VAVPDSSAIGGGSKLVVTRHNRHIGPADSRLSALAGRVDRDKLAEIMLSTFRKEIPGYERLPDSVIRGEVLKVVRENVDLCLDWVAGGTAPSIERFTAFRESAKNRAAEGMPLEDLLRAYRSGGTAAWRVIVAEARPDERDELPLAAELVMDYLDQVSGSIVSAYLEEREHHVSEQERNLRSLLNALLRFGVLDARHRQTAEQIGLPLTGDLAAFAIAIPGEGALAHGRMAVRLRTDGVLALTEGDRVVGVAPPWSGSASPLPPAAIPPGAVAVVDVEVGREELFGSLADVRYGIDIALRRGREGVVPLRSLALDLLLAHAPRVATDLRERVVGALGPKDGRSRGDLLNTVETYIGLERDRQQTAERLHIHPNTLDHRLARARELTGLNLDDPEDLATMVLALHGLR
jgi:hypothetical protein